MVDSGSASLPPAAGDERHEAELSAVVRLASHRLRELINMTAKEQGPQARELAQRLGELAQLLAGVERRGALQNPEMARLTQLVNDLSRLRDALSQAYQ